MEQWQVDAIQAILETPVSEVEEGQVKRYKDGNPPIIIGY